MREMTDKLTMPDVDSCRTFKDVSSFSPTLLVTCVTGKIIVSSLLLHPGDYLANKDWSILGYASVAVAIIFCGMYLPLYSIAFSDDLYWINIGYLGWYLGSPAMSNV